jgi:hypothetical protein
VSGDAARFRLIFAGAGVFPADLGLLPSIFMIAVAGFVVARSMRSRGRAVVTNVNV